MGCGAGGRTASLSPIDRMYSCLCSQFACQTDQWGDRWFNRGDLRVSHRPGQDSPAEPAEWISPLHQHVGAPCLTFVHLLHRPSLTVAPCVSGPTAFLRPSAQRGILGCTEVRFLLEPTAEVRTGVGGGLTFSPPFVLSSQERR